MAQAEDWMFDMGLVEGPEVWTDRPEYAEMVARQADLYREASMMILADGQENSLKSLAAEMFEGRDWKWDNA